MHVARTLRFQKNSHTLLVLRIMMMGWAWKLCGRLALFTVLWTHSTQIFGIVDICADGQKFGSSSHWWSLSCSMVARHRHWTPSWRGKLMSLVLQGTTKKKQDSVNTVLLHKTTGNYLFSPLKYSPLKLMHFLNLLFHASKHPSNSPFLKLLRVHHMLFDVLNPFEMLSLEDAIDLLK